MNYSAYTVSKIAQIKMTELLDAEVFDTRFTIIGPGWVKTKIHESTIKAGIDGAGGNFQKTIDKLTASGDVPVEKVVECCNWAIGAKRKIISGRNFSLVFDKWGDEELDVILLQNNEMYKLRRHGN
jgi:NAD(P)-dependent dehydrogenase (short-subunit alcohol dehydrogenase family)